MTAGGFEVLFLGGLGNQLFQFALGEAIHARTGAEVRYSTVAFPDRNGRTLQIPRDVFRQGSLFEGGRRRPSTRRPPWGLLPLVLTSPRVPRGVRRGVREALLRRLDWYVERDLDHDAGLDGLRPPARLIGFWQSWPYSRLVRDRLRKRLDRHRAATDSRGGSRPTVAVHVRLGDRARRGRTDVHHVLTKEYYRSAIDVLSSRHGDLALVLFSDDVPRARGMLGDDHLLVPGEFTGGGPWNTLSLMAVCDHHVTANSSLSWWGANLAGNADGDVIAPRRWFRSRDIRPEDRYPPGWTVI